MSKTLFALVGAVVATVIVLKHQSSKKVASVKRNVSKYISSTKFMVFTIEIEDAFAQGMVLILWNSFSGVPKSADLKKFILDYGLNLSSLPEDQREHYYWLDSSWDLLDACVVHDAKRRAENSEYSAEEIKSMIRRDLYQLPMFNELGYEKTEAIAKEVFKSGLIVN